MLHIVMDKYLKTNSAKPEYFHKNDQDRQDVHDPHPQEEKSITSNVHKSTTHIFYVQFNSFQKMNLLCL